MKSLLTVSVIALSVLSSAASAQAYFELGYGYDKVKTNEESVFGTGATAVRVKPNQSEGVISLKGGYLLSNTFAVEGELQKFRTKGTHTAINAAGNGGTPPASRDEYKSDLSAYRINAKALYLYDINDQLRLNAGAGLSFTQYNQKSSLTRTPANVATPLPLSVPSNKRNLSVGAVASVGLDYALPNNFTVGTDFNFGIDGYSSTAQIMGTIGYRF